MKCPYQTKVTHIKDKGYGCSYDTTEFSECLKEQCPFYYVTRLYSETPIKQAEICRRAESEISSIIRRAGENYGKEKNDQIQNTF